MKNKKNTDPIEKLCSFAFTMSVIGICTIGVCPAFGAMGIAVPVVMKQKGARLTEQQKRKNSKALIGGIISLCLFAVDIVLILLLKNKF